MVRLGPELTLPGTMQGTGLWKIWVQCGWKSYMPQNCNHVTLEVKFRIFMGNSHVPTSPAAAE